MATPFSLSRTPTLRLSEAIPDRVAERAVLTSSTPSTNGSCGPQLDGSIFSCTDSTFGTCCSQNSYCGNTDAYCGTGCNPLYGTCGTPSSVSPSTLASVLRVRPCRFFCSCVLRSTALLQTLLVISDRGSIYSRFLARRSGVSMLSHLRCVDREITHLLWATRSVTGEYRK